jgi:hypothetical protein
MMVSGARFRKTLGAITLVMGLTRSVIILNHHEHWRDEGGRP